MGSFSWRVNGVAPHAAPALEVAVANGQSTDEYKDGALQKVVKLIPVEIVATYTIVLQLAQIVPESQRLGLLIGVLVLGFVLTFLTMYIGRGLYRPKEDPATHTKKRDPVELGQVLLALGAFVLWAYIQGGAFAIGPLRDVPFTSQQFWPYTPALGAIGVLFYAIIIPWFDPSVKVDPGAGKPPPATMLVERAVAAATQSDPTVTTVTTHEDRHEDAEGRPVTSR